MRAAAELERTTPKPAVTPAPTLPADELLGDLLMELGRPQEALAAYESSLALYPNRFNGLLGAARAAQALDDGETAHRYYAVLVEMAVPDPDRAGLKEVSSSLHPGTH